MKSSMKTSQKKTEPKKSSKFTSWPKNAEERKRLYYKYSSGRERLSYQFLEMMIKGEEIFKGVTKQITKRAYIKADAIGDSKSEGLITRKEFPYFLKYLLYFTDLFKAFDKMDEDRNNKLTFDEFVKNRNALEDKMTKSRAEELFKMMDKDGGGSISFDEFCNWALEQPTILTYNNTQFFVVDSTAQDDEDPEEVLTKEEVNMKTQESEEVKEEDSSPVNKDATSTHKQSDIEDKDNEILALKARIQELEEAIKDLQQKGLEGSGPDATLLEELKNLREANEDFERKHKEHTKKAAVHEGVKGDIEKRLAESEIRENELKGHLDEKTKQHQELEKKMHDLEEAIKEHERRIDETRRNFMMVMCLGRNWRRNFMILMNLDKDWRKNFMNPMSLDKGWRKSSMNPMSLAKGWKKKFKNPMSLNKGLRKNFMNLMKLDKD